MVRSLAANGTTLRKPLGQIDAEDLRQAKTNLDKFHLAMPIEELLSANTTAATNALRTLGWRPSDEAQPNHHGDHPPLSTQITTKEPTAIRFDLALYDHMRAQFQSRFARRRRT